MDDIEVEQWTTEGAERLREAASDLAEAVLAHAAAVVAAREGAGFPDVMQASDAIEGPILAYASAQWDFCGNQYPFGALGVGNDEDDDEEPDEVDEVGPLDRLVLVERRDFAVQDEEALLAAGRAAYARAWPDDPPSFAQARVSSGKHAINEIVHADGREALADVDGLLVLGSCSAITEHDEWFGDEPSEWMRDVLEGS